MLIKNSKREREGGRGGRVVGGGGGSGEGGHSHKQSEGLGGVLWVYKIGLK